MSADPPRRRVLHFFTGLPFLLLVALVIALLIKTFLVQAFFVDGASMHPGLVHGNRVLVEKVSYRLRDPRPGDVVVFEKSVFSEPEDLPWHRDVLTFLKELGGFPTGAEQDYIKRVIAGPGDSIRYDGDPVTLTVDGEEVSEPFLDLEVDGTGPSVTGSDCDRLQMEVAEDGCLVPAGQIFVMGDNRGNSEDSRALGPIAIEKVVGKAFAVVWPPSELGLLRAPERE
ncbi:MAG: signal peptidase I [Actinomycetota bacterium]